MHRQLAPRKRHLHARRPFLLDAHPVINVQRTRRSPVRSWSDHKFKVGRTQLRRRHRPRGTEREHRATTDVKRDRRKADVRERDVLSRTLDGFERRKVIKLVLRQVDRHRGRVLVCYG